MGFEPGEIMRKELLFLSLSQKEDMAMKKKLIFAVSLVWLLTANLSYSAMKVSQAQPFPSAQNAKGDLWGENWGDQIVFNWVEEDGVTEYIIYRSTSFNGPWAEIDRLDDRAAKTGGSKGDDTPDARLKDLCYKVEALDAKGNVMRSYEPMCVPKFAGK